MNSELRPLRQGSDVNPDVVQRLRTAVKRGGGNKAVSANSGVKLSSLNNYLRSVHRLPAEAASKVATACNVSIDWLLRGEGPMEYHQVGDKPPGKVEMGASVPPGDREAEHLSDDAIENFDVQRLARALQAADQMFAAENRRPTYRQRIQSMILFYNHLTKLQAILDQEDAEESTKQSP